MFSSLNKSIRMTTHKCGIEVPRSMDKAIAIDAKNQNRYWQNVVDKEMGNVSVVFEILPLGTKPPPGWTRSNGHLVFDVKMDFTRKAYWVKDGQEHLVTGG